VPSTDRTVEIESCSSAIEMALWITASARDYKDTPGMATVRKDGRSRIDQLPRQAAAALWATPTHNASVSAASVSAQIKEAMRLHPRGQWTLATQIVTVPELLEAHGLAPDGSSVTTDGPGALNPAFVCWLMGFPRAWEDCAPTAMPSSPNWAPKS
jgi:hypothetical protein